MTILLKQKGVGRLWLDPSWGADDPRWQSGELVGLAREVAEVNAHLAGFRVTLYGVGVSARELRYRRIFHVDHLHAPTQRWHGRWYSPFQDRDGTVRGHVRIDGEPCVELDISGCQMRILAHQEGIEWDGDPYSFPGSNPKWRAAYKKLAMCMLNAADRETGEASFRSWVLEGNAPGLRVSETIRKMEAALPAEIRHWMFNDAGRYTMTVDAEVCRGVLLRSIDRGIPVISIHDGHLTPVSHEAALYQMICEAWADQFPGRRPAMKRTAADGARLEVGPEYYLAEAPGGRE